MSSLSVEQRLEVVRKTLVGACFSVVVFLLFVGIKWLAPEASEIGLDMGARVLAGKERLTHFGTGLPPASQADSYTFLDVDPEDLDYSVQSRRASSQQVCDAAQAAGKVSGPLDCGATRRLNRQLLKALLNDLQARGPRMIVLDVALSRDTDSGAEVREDDELRQAICQSEVPLLYASGMPLVQRDDETVQALIQLEGPPDLASDCGPRVSTAVALPVGEHPVRRFPRCYRVTEPGGTRLRASLPYLAAHSLSAGRIVDEEKLCSGLAESVDAEEPRVVFTLPPLPGHAGSEISSEGANWRSFYHRVYQRCRADAFWDGRSACGTDVAFKDRIVVIGTSSAERHDRHYTPLGEMPGPQLVINAMRSFVLYPQKEAGSPHVAELWFIAFGGVVWAFFHYVCAKVRRDGGLRRWTAPLKLFGLWVTIVALLIVIGTVVWPYYQVDQRLSVDLLVPVLAGCTEAYAEAAVWMSHKLETAISWLLARCGALFPSGARKIQEGDAE